MMTRAASSLLLGTTAVVVAAAAAFVATNAEPIGSWCNDGLYVQATATHAGKLYALGANITTCMTALHCPHTIYVWDGLTGELAQAIELPAWAGADAVQYDQELVVAPDGDALVRSYMQTVHHEGTSTYGTLTSTAVRKYSVTTGKEAWMVNSSRSGSGHVGAIGSGLLYSNVAGSLIDVIDIVNGTLYPSSSLLSSSADTFAYHEPVVAYPNGPSAAGYLVADWGGNLAGYSLADPRRPEAKWPAHTTASDFVNGQPRVTPDGTRVVASYSGFSSGSNLCTFDAATGAARCFHDPHWTSLTVFGTTDSLAFIVPFKDHGYDQVFDYGAVNLTSMELAVNVPRPDVDAVMCGLATDGSAAVCLTGNYSTMPYGGIGATVLDGRSGAVVAQYAPSTFGFSKPVTLNSGSLIVEPSADGTTYLAYFNPDNMVAMVQIPRPAALSKER